MKKNNHTKAEGAVFDRRPTAPPTPDELAKLLARDQGQDEAAGSQSLAIQVLADHYGTAVVLVKNTPHIGKNAITRPLAGAVPGSRARCVRSTGPIEKRSDVAS